MNKNISIIILNYCSFDNTYKCVESIINSKVSYNYEVIIIDNCSPDGSGKQLKEKFKSNENVVVILHHVNNGYAAGNNVGLQYAIKKKSDYIIICNPDIIFKENCIQLLCDAFSNDSHIGLVAPKILNRDLSTYIFSPRKKQTDLKSLYLLKKPFSKLNILGARTEMFYTYAEHEIPQYFFSASGSCFCINNKAALELYPLDDKTFMYMEETILGIRINRLGFLNYYCPSAVVIHNHKENSSIPSIKLINIRRESEIYYAKEYLKCNDLALLPLKLYYGFAILISALLKR